MTVRDIRKEKKITQQYLANKLFVSQKLVSGWETGNREPSVLIIPKLAKILNCSIEELVLAIIETKKEVKNGKVHSWFY